MAKEQISYTQPGAEAQSSTFEQSFQLASRQEQIIYDQKGLDYASNLPFVNKRDAAGNLIINGTIQEVPDDEAAQYNETVIVEANDRLYTNRSVNRAVDTQFKYFKFPPTIISRQTDIGEIDIELPENNLDIFSARYTPDFVRQWFIFAPSYAVPGKAHGFQRLEFNNVLQGPLQIDPGTYTITPDLIESGKNLRIRYKVDVHYANPSVEGDPFDEIELKRKEIVEVGKDITTHRNTLNTIALNKDQYDLTVYDELRKKITSSLNDLIQKNRELQSVRASLGKRIIFRTRLQRKSADFQPPFEGNAAIAFSRRVLFANAYDSLSGEYLLENRNMRAWDKWYIEGECTLNNSIVDGKTKGGLYFADQSYWEIEAVDP